MYNSLNVKSLLYITGYINFNVILKRWKKGTAAFG